MFVTHSSLCVYVYTAVQLAGATHYNYSAVVHAVPCSKISMYKLLQSQELHPSGYLIAKLQQKLLCRFNLWQEWAAIRGSFHLLLYEY